MTTKAEDVETVEAMLQEAITLLDSRLIKDTTKNFVIKEYYQININNHIRLEKFGKEVTLLSEQEIKVNNIKEYIEIEINYRMQTATVALSVEPNPTYSLKAIYIEYYKEEGRFHVVGTTKHEAGVARNRAGLG